MEKYELLPGVVLVSAGPEHMLVADLQAREKVYYLQPLNDAGAFYWKLMEEGKDLKTMVTLGSQHFEMDPLKTMISLLAFMKKLQRSGYLIIEGDHKA